MKYTQISASFMFSAFLVGCGGGSSNSSSSSNPVVVTPTVTASFTGNVTEPLDTTNTRTIYGISHGNSSVEGTSNSTVVQDSHGALTTIGEYSLSGNYGVKEIKGNRWYALGRWDKGLVVSSKETGSKEVSQYSNGSEYYVTLHSPDKAIIDPTGKVLTCGDYSALKAQYRGGGTQHSSFITPALSNGSITLSATGDVKIAFTVTAEGTITDYETTAAWVTSFNQYNGLTLLGLKGIKGQSSSIGYADIGTDGSEGYVIGGLYNITLASGARYRATFSMVCK